MKIVADENIPGAEALFRELGSITFLPGRSISNSDLVNADILLVRSVTQVDASLLKNTPVKFVGSTTIGEDHIDVSLLKRRKIGYTCAPGSNARSVVEYIIAVIFNYCLEFNKNLIDLSVGIIGDGNIGSRLKVVLRALGLKVNVCDPPKAINQRNKMDILANTGASIENYSSYEEISRSDILTFHVPLTRNTEFPSWHMVNDSFLSNFNGSGVLNGFASEQGDKLIINSARGGVVDNQALLKHLQSKPGLNVALDVWENEPSINSRLMDQCFLATPHVAGYSQDGKVAGTRMIFDAAVKYFNIPHISGKAITENNNSLIKLSLNRRQDERAIDAVTRLLNEIYPIKEDDQLLRKMKDYPDDQQGAYFDELRKNYRVRREFANYSVEVPETNSEDGQLLIALGFQLIASNKSSQAC